MTYSTVMVNLELGCSNAGVMAAAGDLAERFGSTVIGIAACRRVPVAAMVVDYIRTSGAGRIAGNSTARSRWRRRNSATRCMAGQRRFHGGRR